MKCCCSLTPLQVVRDFPFSDPVGFLVFPLRQQVCSAFLRARGSSLAFQGVCACIALLLLSHVPLGVRLVRCLLVVRCLFVLRFSVGRSLCELLLPLYVRFRLCFVVHLLTGSQG